MKTHISTGQRQKIKSAKKKEILPKRRLLFQQQEVRYIDNSANNAMTTV